jgi:hypothetical protein
MKKLNPEEKIKFKNINCRESTKALFDCYKKLNETDDACILRILKSCRVKPCSVLELKYIKEFLINPSMGKL